jgi:hypothetical protein
MGQFKELGLYMASGALGYRLQVTGYRLQVTGYRLQVTGYRLQVTGRAVPALWSDFVYFLSMVVYLTECDTHTSWLG